MRSPAFYCMGHVPFSFLPRCSDNYKLLWPIKQAYNSCSHLQPSRSVGKEKWKAPEFYSNSPCNLTNLPGRCFLLLINNSVNTWIQPDLVYHPPPECRSVTPPPFSSSQERPTYGEEGGQVELSFRCCKAETDVIYIPATVDSTVTQRRPFHVPCPSKAAPELRLYDPIHRVASRGRLPDTGTLSIDSASSVTVSFFKNSFRTCVLLYRHTSSHIKAANANRCEEDKKAEKNRSLKLGPAV